METKFERIAKVLGGGLSRRQALVRIGGTLLGVLGLRGTSFAVDTGTCRGPQDEGRACTVPNPSVPGAVIDGHCQVVFVGGGLQTVCIVDSIVACTAADQCHVAGTRNPATGLCSNPTAPDGTPCNFAGATTGTNVAQCNAFCNKFTAASAFLRCRTTCLNCSSTDALCVNGQTATCCQAGTVCQSGTCVANGVCLTGTCVPA
jgi:hypothetical protein